MQTNTFLAFQKCYHHKKINFYVKTTRHSFPGSSQSLNFIRPKTQRPIPIQDGPFQGWSRMRMEVKRLFLPKICHTYLASIKLVTVVSYLKKIRKYVYINHVTHSLLLLASVFFHEISATFVISKNTVTFFWVFKSCFNKNGCNFDNVSKIGYPKPS